MPSTKRIRPSKSADTRKDQAKYKRLRAQHQDYSQHAFLDASATVHAGLFGARRLPEIKGLWRGVVADKIDNEVLGVDKVRRVGQSGGGKVSSRHLRRRTGSHRPRRRHRYPRGDYTDESITVCNSKGDTDQDTVSRFKHTGNTKVSIEKAASIQSFDIQSTKKADKATTLCRRARRKPAFLKASHSTWWAPSQKYPYLTSETKQKNHKWIPTHHWHAKRFHIATLFGWDVPLLHCNRGSRAALRLAHEKCTIQDASWEVDGCALVLRLESTHHKTKPPLSEVVQLLQKICGVDSSFLKKENVLGGNELGEGLIYEVNCFPMRLVGTATFLFGSKENVNAVSVHVMVHPSILDEVQSLLETIIKDCDEYCTTISTMPVSILRIRGVASLSTIVDVLSIDTGPLAQSCRFEEHLTTDVGSNELSHCSLFEFDASRSLPRELLQSTAIDTNFDHRISDLDRHKIIIKMHRPNDHVHCNHLSHNNPSSGFDIYCHPSIVSHLFQSFILNNACAIGLTEDSRACLEAFPPLPIFPRDYPDTVEGKRYWEGSNLEEGQVNGNVIMDWVVIRTYLDAPWGRMNTQLKNILHYLKKVKSSKNKQHLKPLTESTGAKFDDNEKQGILIKQVNIMGRKTNLIKWPCIIPLLDDKSTSVVVVRGSFGDPFLSLLYGYGKFQSSHSNKAKKHKHRRPYKSIIKASPLSKSESEAHSNVCRNLLNALSLPAVLRCEIWCDGKGTLDTGDLLFELYDNNDGDSVGANKHNDDNAPIGVIAAGGFSPTRGICFGVGFVCARRFIEALMNGTVDAVGMKSLQIDNSPKMMLMVQLKKLSPDYIARHALISLLL